MSLTAQVRDPLSPVGRFLRERLPNAEPILAEVRARSAGAATIRPAVSAAPACRVVGTAFDWRLRYYLSATPGRSLRPRPSDDPLWAGFLCSLDETVRRTRPVGRRLDRGAEDWLNRHCVVLARGEPAERSQLKLPDPAAWLMSSPRSTVGRLLDDVADDWLDDLRALSWAAHDALGDRLALPAVLGPTFAGSADVGGAVADLILGDCLVEVKTTLAPPDDRSWLDQLLGYALLDYPDRYRIRSIGLYLARQAIFLRWPLDEVREVLAGRDAACLGELRLQLRQALRERRYRPVPRGVGTEAGLARLVMNLV